MTVTRSPAPAPSRLRHRRLSAARAAEPFDGVLSRRLLREEGVDRGVIAREIAADRWVSHGTQTIALHTGSLTPLAQWWRAVWEVGERHTLLDGVSALQAAGLTGFSADAVHVSVRHTAHIGRIHGVKTHKVIRRLPDELAHLGPPRVRSALAAVRAAHWAVSDRQAALVLVMPVQQRLITGPQLMSAVCENVGRNRRALIAMLVADIVDGAHALGELDLVRELRKRGLPAPSRQAVRRGPNGVIYLDLAYDEAQLIIEVDGAGHWLGLAQATDDLRQNSVSIAGELVLRVSLVGWRLNPDAYLDQICHAYWARLDSRRA